VAVVHTPAFHMPQTNLLAKVIPLNGGVVLHPRLELLTLHKQTGIKL
jgi:hypothetical protein